MSKETIDHVLVHSSGETKTTVEYCVVSGIHTLSAKARPSGVDKHLGTEIHC